MIYELLRKCNVLTKIYQKLFWVSQPWGLIQSEEEAKVSAYCEELVYVVISSFNIAAHSKFLDDIKQTQVIPISL